MTWYKGKDRILLSFCFARLKRDDKTFLWGLWERAENTTASDASPTKGTLIASLGGRSQGCRQIHKRRTWSGPQRYASSPFMSGPELHTWSVFS